MITNRLARRSLLILFMIAMTTPFLSSSVYALDVSASSCSLEDVQSAIGAVEASGGGTVYIPEGDCIWDDGGFYGAIIDNGSVSLVGAGVGKTILRTTNGSNFVYYTTRNPHPFW